MKQLDRLLLRSFIGPFLVAFAIALFVFLMQTLWVYIDEIIGKGAGLLLIIELVAYLSVSLMPMALPVAVLIASVMTMGNLAEHYELAALKSAGVPLLRVMAPLMLAGVAIAGFSFACSNNLIPVANLKARTRLYDIRKQKPSLSLEEGAFNDDFQGFAIRIGEKAETGGGLEDVMLFKQGGNLRGRIASVNAERGSMQVTPDERYFVLELEDGYQYEQPENEVSGRGRTFPFVRTKFASYRKAFDLSEFEMQRTDEDAFQNHQTMLSVAQLRVAIDSIRAVMAERRERLGIEVGRYVSPLKARDQSKRDSIEALRQDSLKLAADLALAANDSAGVALAEPPPTSAEPPPKSQERSVFSEATGKARVFADRAAGIAGSAAALGGEELDYRLFLSTRPVYKQKAYLDRASQFSRTIKSYAEGAQRRLEQQRRSLVSHIYELHTKFSGAIACFIFLFIGAPMGAIIRKGGFGYPILVSVIFFMIFIVTSIMSKKLMQSYTLQPGFAAWLPTLIIFPIGLALTFVAMLDRSFNLAAPLQRVLKWTGRLMSGGLAAALVDHDDAVREEEARGKA